jgi:hypothetical protein
MTAATSTNAVCSVRIVNDINGRTVTVESSRDRSAVFFDLRSMVKTINHNGGEVLKASLHLCRDSIVLHFHCPYHDDGLSKVMLSTVEPLYQVERLIRNGGPQA